MQSLSSSRSGALLAYRAGAARTARSSARRSAARQLIGVRAQQQESSPFEGLINTITTAINKSPLAEGKKLLAVAQAGQYDEAAIAKKLDDLIASNPVVVFSWTRCPFCVKAKGLLDQVGAKYSAVELDTMADGNAIRAELAKRTNRTSVPNVFISGTSYGGCNDGPGIMTLHKEGKLVTLLTQAGAM